VPVERAAKCQFKAVDVKSDVIILTLKSHVITHLFQLKHTNQ